MPNSYFQSVADLRSEILTELGGNSVDVELVAADLDKAIKDALRTYNHYRPHHKWKAIDVSPSKHKYDVTEPGIIGVWHVSFLTHRYDTEAIRDNPFYANYYADIGSGNQTWGDYAQILQYNQTSRRTSSADNEWTTQWEGETLYLYINVPFTPEQVAYRYTVGFTFNNDSNTGLQLIPEDDAQLFLDYAVARAKVILSRARGKWQGVIGPGGSVVQNDWQQLNREGREDRDKLEKEFQARRRPLPPVME